MVLMLLAILLYFLKYLSVGVIIAFFTIFLNTNFDFDIDYQTVLYLGISSAVICWVLDTFSPATSQAFKFGQGASLGNKLIKFPSNIEGMSGGRGYCENCPPVANAFDGFYDHAPAQIDTTPDYE